MMSSDDEGVDLFSNRVCDDLINLSIGAPGPDTLKKSAELFEKASNHRLAKIRDGTPNIFQYGPECGYGEYLKELGYFLSLEYGDEVSHNDLLLTCGATSGLHLSVTTLLQPGNQTIVFIECPTYFIALDVLQKDLNFQIVPIPMEEDGVNVEIFEDLVQKEFQKVERANNSGKFWGMFYTIPTYQNPTGAVLSEVKSRKVVEIARKYDLLVFCDDVYNLLYYDDPAVRPKRLLAYDSKSDSNYEGGHVLSNGTFSKILAPGIRVGWIETGPRIRQGLKDSGVLASGGSLNNVLSGFIASSLKLGLQREHVKNLRFIYSERVQAIKSVFDQDLPKNFECQIPHGGYFIWVKGPKHFDGVEFARVSKEQFGVQVLPGSRCSSCPGMSSQDLSLTCSNAFRISIAYYQAQLLSKAAKNICLAISALQKTE